jgi:tRNA(Ile)-lysidine synthase
MRRAHTERAIEAIVASALEAQPGEVLVAAVSGGPDSAALAGMLARHAEDAGASLVLGHVNHGVRATAFRDEGVVLALGAALGARTIVRALVPDHASEARLRAARYAALAEIARAVGSRRVVTAHHAEDQTETVLLALFRGTGPNGLAGMPPLRRLGSGLSLLRPFLGVRHAELVHYCAARLLPYALDPTNDDLAYRRNAVRGALAELRRDFPALDAAVARCAAIAREERAGSERAALRRRLREELDLAAGQVRDMTYERLDAVARALEGKRPGRHFLSRGLEVTIRRSP